MVNKVKLHSLNIKKLLLDLENRLRAIYGKKIKKVYLYGSYARGENSDGSDVDIMLLLDMNQEEIIKHREKVLDVVVDLTTEYGAVLSVIENNYDYFYDWVDVLPFFANIEKEGVDIFGQN
ncbi:MAG: nucleotidyltransferase domain-containing protein [Firmicutes bacterium]|nr:nucleotidyltransferase domain-containing protein [Bacillota bacterium]